MKLINGDVLVWHRSGFLVHACLRNNTWEISGGDGSGYSREEITHWVPEPAGPTSGDSK